MINGAAWSDDKPSIGRLNSNSLSYDGVDDYIGITKTDALKLTNMTISAWFKSNINTINDYRGLIFGDEPVDGSSWAYRLMIEKSDGQLYADFQNDPGSLVRVYSGVNVDDNNWHHVAAVRDDALKTLTLYLDGVEIDSESYTGKPVPITDTPITIGRSGYRGGDGSREFSYPFKGNIDNLRMYNRTLSLSEIQWLAGKSTPGSSLGITVENKNTEDRRFAIATSSVVSAEIPFAAGLTVKNPDGSDYTGYKGNINFTCTDSNAEIPNSYIFSAEDGGKKNFDLTLNTGGYQQVTISSGIKGLVGYWKLDEGEGSTVIDFLGLNSPGTLNGGAVWDISDKAPLSFYNPISSLHFDGIDDYVNITKSAALNSESGTISAWFKANTAAEGEQAIISDKISNNNLSYRIFIRDGVLHYGNNACELS